MHEILFKNQQALTAPDLEKYAKDIGLDMGKFKAAIDSHKFAAQVENDTKQGSSLGVRAPRPRSSTASWFRAHSLSTPSRRSSRLSSRAAPRSRPRPTSRETKPSNLPRNRKQRTRQLLAACIAAAATVLAGALLIQGRPRR
jgi:hypothetical protein